MITAEYLREILDYKKDSGFFYWKKKINKNIIVGSRAGTFGKPHSKYDYLRIEITIKGRTYKAHRLAWLWMTGKWPTNVIDHIDSNPLNNKWINLRDIPSALNGRRYFTEEQIQYIKLSMENGVTQSEVARNLNIANSTICNWYKKLKENDYVCAS